MTSTRTGIAHQPLGQTMIEYLPLEEVRVRGWVVDVSSRLLLSQTFYNPSDQPTGRAKYVFPLPANAAVCAFELELEDGIVIVGEVKEKEEAALTFNHAIDEGNVAALVERVTDDIFTISVGSIPATTRVTAHLTFVMDLLNEALRDHVRLQLPMHIAERYGTPPVAMNNASSANSHTRVHITVDVQTSDVIHAIRSPTHRIELRRYKRRSHGGHKSQRRMSVVWKSLEFLTGDFVITIHAKDLDKPRCFAEVLGDEGATIAMQLTLVPKVLATKVPSQEYIFIIDRSGSMAGASIETAKKSLDMLLRLLPSSQTVFNIFSFGTDTTNLWQRSRALDPVSLAEATSHVACMGADYGGTEIPKALQSVFKSRGSDRPVVAFLLTDGQITDTLAASTIVSNAVRSSPRHALLRLFVLGIGDSVSSDTCTHLARQGNGEYLFALSAEDIFGKCARLLNAGRSKTIEHIDIDWANDISPPAINLSSPTTLTLPAGIPAIEPPPHVQQAPHSLIKIFSGFRFTVFVITSFKTVPTSVRLITKLDGVPESQELVVSVTKVKPFGDSHEHSLVPMLHTLAARKLIMELDDGVAPPPAPAPGDALLASEDDLRKAGIVRLGLTYKLISKHTSFVAIQKGGERRNGGRSSMAWARSRLRQTDLDGQEDSSPGEVPSFLDDFINGMASVVTSVFSFFNNPAALTSMTNAAFSSRSHRHRPGFPGTYVESDSDTSESRRGRSPRRMSRSSRRRSVSSHGSNDTFSTLSSLEGSSCSACWTPSRSPSPLPRFQDPPEQRAPSPDFLRDMNPLRPGGPNVGPSGSHNHSGSSTRRHPIPQEVHDLFRQMDVNGSFSATPLLTQLVGETVLSKADELGIDKKVWATVVVVAYIQTRLQDEADVLDLMSEKAREFVEGCEWFRKGRARRFEEMLREAVVLLSPASPGPMS